MRKLVIVFIVLCLAVPCLAALTTSIDNRGTWRNGYQWTGHNSKDRAWDWAVEIEDLLDGTTGNAFLYMTPGTAPASANEGQLYYNDTADLLYFRTASAWVALDSAGGNSLGAAYNAGSKITAITDVVEIEVTDGSNNVALLIDHDEATNDNDAMQITNAADAATAVSLQIDGTAGYDIQGTGDTWQVSTAGVAGLVGATIGNSDLVFTEPTTNDVTILADGDGILTISAASMEDVDLNLATANTLTLTSSTGVDTVAFGDLDAFTGVAAITGDAADMTIQITADAGGEDLLIQQAGAVDGSLDLRSAGTGTDAVKILASAGGLDIDATNSTMTITNTANGAADDLTIAQVGANDSSIIITAAGTGADAVSLITSAATGDIKINSGDMLDIDAADDITIDLAGAAGEDILVTNTGGSITLSATEAAADAIVISADTAVGGIDITSNADIDMTTTGAAGEDISITNTGGSVNVSATEDIATAIVISSSAGGIDVTADGAAASDLDLVCTNGSTNISGGEADAAAVTIAAGAGGVDISSAATFDIDITATGGRILGVASEAAGDQFKIDAQGTIAGNAINLETTDGGILLNADNAANGDITIDAQDDITITADGIITTDGAVYPTSVVSETHVANDTLDTAADVGTLMLVGTDAVVLTLPAVATGLKYKIMNTGADGAVEIHVDTDAADKFLGGCGFTALDDGDKITNTKASADLGDYVVIEYGTADGWYITEMVGTWADGGA